MSENIKVVTQGNTRINVNNARGIQGLKVSTGSKYSAIDAGSTHEISIDDDFLYVCVLEGTAGNAKWKRTPLQLI